MEVDHVLPISFQIPKKQLFWAVIGVLSLFLFTYLFIIGLHKDNIREFWAGCLLIILTGFCTLKLFLEVFMYKITLTDTDVTLRNLWGRSYSINWKDVETVILSKHSPIIVIKSSQNKIKLSLKVENMDVMVDMFSDYLPDEKFVGFE